MAWSGVRHVVGTCFFKEHLSLLGQTRLSHGTCQEEALLHSVSSGLSCLAVGLREGTVCGHRARKGRQDQAWWERKRRT